MTKTEAAAFLNVSPRTIEGMAAKGKLTPAKAKGKRGDITVYDESELERLKAERGQIVFTAAPEASAPASAEPQALARLSDVRPSELVAALTAAIDRARERNHIAPTVSDLAQKLLLSIPEAAALSGVPAAKLRSAVNAGSLRTVKSVGRGLGKVRRADLDAYVKKLK